MPSDWQTYQLNGIFKDAFLVEAGRQIPIINADGFKKCSCFQRRIFVLTAGIGLLT